jgi:type I restriction enzyme S subunit
MTAIDNLNKGWTIKRFEELFAEPQRNGIYKTKEFHGRGQKIINMGELFGHDFISDQEMKRVELTPKELEKSLVKDGDLLFARRSLVLEGSGKCSLVVRPSEDTTFESSIIRTRLNKNEAEPKFYYYLFRSPLGRALMSSIATQTAVSGITGSNLVQLRVPHPPLPIQRKIAAILSAYDDLIENNTRRIEILEEMARSIYREWFVKFRFPGHEQVQTVDSELGLIPEGWKLKKLDELGSIGRGKSKHRPRNDPSLYGGDYPFVQTGEVKEALLYITHYSQTYNEKGLAQSKLWEPKTLLLTIAANIAETAILKIPACFPDSIVGFVADSEQVTPEFIKFRIDDIKEKMQSFSRGTAQDNLSLDKIKLFYFLVPDKDYIIIFDNYTAPLFSQVHNLLLKNANLRQTRDLLLPQLISGEINIENLDINAERLAA